MKRKTTALVLFLALLIALSFFIAKSFKSAKAENRIETTSVTVSEIITTIEETLLSTTSKAVETTTTLVTTTDEETTVEEAAEEEETTKESRFKRFKKSSGNHECFEDCAFIGNSRTLDLKDYGLVKNVYASVGVNVSTVYTKCAPGSSRPIMDEIGNRHFKRYFLQFGENECGWSSESAFISRYKKVVEDIKRKDPRAKIYLQSMIPITKSASDKAEFDCTNERIESRNELIKQIAKDEGVEYIDVASYFKDIRGNLPDDAAYDGVHLNKSSCEKWLEVLENKM